MFAQYRKNELYNEAFWQSATRLLILTKLSTVKDVEHSQRFEMNENDNYILYGNRSIWDFLFSVR